MSSTIKLTQRLADLASQLINDGLTEDERDDIEAEISEIENQLEEEYNRDYDEEVR